MVILNDFGAETLYLKDYKPLPVFRIYKEPFQTSNEVYFGRTAPLSIILLKYATQLKELLGDKTKKYNFKDKKFVESIKNVCDKFGSEVANEINADKCTFLVVLEKEPNACCLPLITCFDNRPLDKNGNVIENKVNLDKYVDLESIVQTKTGYKFKSPSNKLLLINLNIGLLWENTPEEIAAIICHELGHCFQQGIFGTYKNYSDIMYQQEIQNLDKRLDGYIHSSTNPFGKLAKLLLPLPGFWKFFTFVITYFFKPSFLNNTIFTKMNLLFHNKIHGRIDDETFKMKDKIKLLDNGKISNDDKSKIEHQSYTFDSNRENEIEKEVKDTYNDYKKINLYKKDEKISKFAGFKRNLWLFMNTLAYDLNNHETNFYEIITLSRYAKNQYAQQVFYRKYEFFADIFASAYGFGPSLYKTISNWESKDYDFIYNKVFNKGLYKVPLFKAMAYYGAYNRIRNEMVIDEHGEAYERASAMYTNLINELKNNPDLTTSQKKAIEDDCKMYKTLDEKYYNMNKKDGALYKTYNKMIAKKITTKSDKVEDLVLGPILDIAKEENKKKK